MVKRFRLRLRRAMRILLGRGDFDPAEAARAACSVSADIAHRLHDRLLLFGPTDAHLVLQEIEHAVIDGLRDYDRWRDTPEDDATIPF